MAERTPVPTTSRANLSNVDNALASKPKFGNLARICSDEIEDFDPILSRPGTPPELGKRANPPNVQSPAAAESGKKPVKRMVCFSLLESQVAIFSLEGRHSQSAGRKISPGACPKGYL